MTSSANPGNMLHSLQQVASLRPNDKLTVDYEGRVFVQPASLLRPILRKFWRNDLQSTVQALSNLTLQALAARARHQVPPQLLAEAAGGMRVLRETYTDSSPAQFIHCLDDLVEVLSFAASAKDADAGGDAAAGVADAAEAVQVVDVNVDGVDEAEAVHVVDVDVDVVDEAEADAGVDAGADADADADDSIWGAFFGAASGNISFFQDEDYQQQHVLDFDAPTVIRN